MIRAKLWKTLFKSILKDQKLIRTQMSYLLFTEMLLGI